MIMAKRLSLTPSISARSQLERRPPCWWACRQRRSALWSRRCAGERRSMRRWTSSGVLRSRTTGTSVASAIRCRYRGGSSRETASHSTWPCATRSLERRCWSRNSKIISAQRAQNRGPMRGNSVWIWWAKAFFSVFPCKGPNFLRTKSGVLLMGCPPTSGFFFATASSQAEQFVEVILHIAIAPALGQELKIRADQSRTASEQEGDLSGLEPLAGQLRATREGRQIVGHCLRRVVHDPADLRGGLALEGQSYDLSTMGQYGPDVVQGAAHGDEHVGMRFADDNQDRKSTR